VGTSATIKPPRANRAASSVMLLLAAVTVPERHHPGPSNAQPSLSRGRLEAASSLIAGVRPRAAASAAGRRVERLWPAAHG
jgi:hypothetical protein